jgi:uncharacterized damage-inducible protein DinB
MNENRLRVTVKIEIRSKYKHSRHIGLLFHAAEHATRHVGQAVTTAKILRGADPAADQPFGSSG